MFNTNDEEKVVLIHLILEASANSFFSLAYPIMPQFGEQVYFKIHSEADDEHENMGRELLEGLSPVQYNKLFEIQKRGWKMMLAVSDRIAELAFISDIC